MKDTRKEDMRKEAEEIVDIEVCHHCRRKGSYQCEYDSCEQYENEIEDVIHELEEERIAEEGEDGRLLK